MGDDSPAAGKLIVIGAGGHGKVVADAALAAGWQVLGFVDAGAGASPLPGLPLLGDDGVLPEIRASHPEAKLVAAVGDNGIRRRLADRYADCDFATVVHPSAVVSPYASLGPGTVVMAGAVVNAGAIVGRHAILNTACSVDHDCRLGDYVHISPGARLAGDVTVLTGAHIGTGASVIPGRTIGEWSIVGAGAVAIADVPPRIVVAGVPARKLRDL